MQIIRQKKFIQNMAISYPVILPDEDFVQLKQKKELLQPLFNAKQDEASKINKIISTQNGFNLRK